MIGKMQDFVSAAIVANAVDSASRSAPETREQASMQTAAAETQAQAPKPEAPVAAMEKGQDTGARNTEDKSARERADDQKLDEKTVDYMTKELNELMGKINCNLQFTYHKDVDVMSVKMVNKETKKVIKEFPPEEMVESMAKAREWIGAFLDKNA